MHRSVPTMITAAGLGVGLLGVFALHEPCPEWLAILLLWTSVALDLLDGAVARRWGWESAGGAWLDWQSDCAISIAICFAVLPFGAAIQATVGLVILSTSSRASGGRVSGRVLVTALATACALLA